jgi:hypothetical protein
VPRSKNARRLHSPNTPSWRGAQSKKKHRDNFTLLYFTLLYFTLPYLTLPYLTSRTFRSKKREYLKGKINELETNNKNKNIRHSYIGINELKKGYQPRVNIIKNENGNLLAVPQSVLNRWKNFFNQVLHVRWVHDVWQMDVRTSELLVSEPNLVEIETAIGKLKRCKPPGTDQIPAELIKPAGKLLSDTCPIQNGLK